MNKNTSYRQMLRNRCPKIVSHALKWCKAKEKWLDYVYKNQIWPLCSKKERLNQTKLILGINGNERKFDFKHTIGWKELTKDETTYWTYVADWVNFFVLNYAYIENAYNISVAAGKSIEQIKVQIMKDWLMDLCPKTTDSKEEAEKKNEYINNFVNFLIDCFDGNIK